jgi:hypothetical protein
LLKNPKGDENKTNEQLRSNVVTHITNKYGSKQITLVNYAIEQLKAEQQVGCHGNSKVFSDIVWLKWLETE